MNVILFKNQFEPLILAGVKRSTIRASRKDGKPRAREGETLSLRVWTGLPYRSKQREFARRTAKFVIPIRVSNSGFERPDIRCLLTPRILAKDLGFPDWRTAKAWYKAAHGLPFDGELIHFPATGTP